MFAAAADCWQEGMLRGSCNEHAYEATGRLPGPGGGLVESVRGVDRDISWGASDFKDLVHFCLQRLLEASRFGHMTALLFVKKEIFLHPTARHCFVLKPLHCRSSVCH